MDRGSNSTRLGAPLPADWSVERGLEVYLQENGFTKAGYDALTTSATLLGLTLPIPNTPRHRWAIRRHDLHHVVTGYGTDLAGEAEISAWEWAAGVRPLGPYTAGIVGSLVLLGLSRWPARTLAARAASRGVSLFRDDVSYEATLGLRIGELRDRLGVPERGLGGHRRLHARAPAL